MKQYKVSVCVPIYNTEKYIEKCVRSLFSQTLDDIEYVFVDDCSPDNSIAILGSIIKEYPDRKDSIKIIRHEKNQGHAGAFKTLLMNASGEYIITCDSDDWVEPNIYERLYTKAVETEADVVGCGHYIEHSDKQIYISQFKGSANERFRNWIRRNYQLYSWATLVHRSIVEQLEYVACGYVEDCTRACQVLCYAKNYIYVPEALYHYRCEQQGVTSYAKLKDSMRMNIVGYNWIAEFLNRKYGDEYAKEVLEAKLCLKFSWLKNGVPEEFYTQWPEANRDDILKRLPLPLYKKFLLWLAIHRYRKLGNLLINAYKSIKR